MDWYVVLRTLLLLVSTTAAHLQAYLERPLTGMPKVGSMTRWMQCMLWWSWSRWICMHTCHSLKQWYYECLHTLEVCTIRLKQTWQPIYKWLYYMSQSVYGCCCCSASCLTRFLLVPYHWHHPCPTSPAGRCSGRGVDLSLPGSPPLCQCCCVQVPHPVGQWGAAGEEEAEP